MTLGKPTDEKVAADRDLQEHQQTFKLYGDLICSQEDGYQGKRRPC